MDCMLTSFVGNVGPGQIVDRHCLVAIPVGFAKVIVCCSNNYLCIFLPELKEQLDEPILDLRLSVKAFLTIGTQVLKGLVATNLTTDRRFKVPTNREFGATVFDKTQISSGREKGCNKCVTEEVIQLCVYGSRHKTRKKSLLGYIHIDLSSVKSQSSSYCVEGWYKIFPSSSFLPGYPISGINNNYCIRNRTCSTSPSSPISVDIMNMLISLSAKQQKARASVSSLPAEKETMSLPCSEVRRKSDTYNVKKAFHDKSNVEQVIIPSPKSSTSESNCSLSINDSCNNNSTLQRGCSFQESNDVLEAAASEKKSDKLTSKKKKRKPWFYPKFLYRDSSKTQARTVVRSKEVISPSCPAWGHGSCLPQLSSSNLTELLKKEIKISNNNNETSNTINIQTNSWKKKKNKNSLESDQRSESETKENYSINYKKRAFGSKKSNSVRSWAQSLRQSFKFSVSHDANDDVEEDCLLNTCVSEKVSQPCVSNEDYDGVDRVQVLSKYNQSKFHSDRQNANFLIKEISKLPSSKSQQPPDENVPDKSFDVIVEMPVEQRITVEDSLDINSIAPGEACVDVTVSKCVSPWLSENK